MHGFSQSSRTLAACAVCVAFMACLATTTRGRTTGTAAGSVADTRARERAAAASARAKETEHKMTDDERFSLLFSVFGANPVSGTPRDKRIPPTVPNSAGYTPGIPRLGVPALRSTDASMGVTNPPPAIVRMTKAPPRSRPRYSSARASTRSSRATAAR